MNDGLERIWKEVCGVGEVQSQHLPGETKEDIFTYLSKSSCCVGRDSNPATPEYNTQICSELVFYNISFSYSSQNLH
jgi:hypothetical protein